MSDFLGGGTPCANGTETRGDTGDTGPEGPAGAGSGDVLAANAPNDNEVAIWTGSSTIEGMTESEFKALLNLEAGTDFLAPAAIISRMYCGSN